MLIPDPENEWQFPLNINQTKISYTMANDRPKEIRAVTNTMYTKK